MKVSFLLSMARQVEGEYHFIDIVYAHKDGERVHHWFRKNQNELPTTAVIAGTECVINYGIHEDIEVAED
jgi:hypothetical protein